MTTTPTQIGRDELVAGIVRIGDRGLATEDDAAVERYFAPDFVSHGPFGNLHLDAVKAFFASLRAAFEGLAFTRDQFVVEGDHVAVRTTLTGTFRHELTISPVGPLPPTGEAIAVTLLAIFRFDDTGRLAEEWVQLDVRSFLQQLGFGEQP